MMPFPRLLLHVGFIHAINRPDFPVRTFVFFEREFAFDRDRANRVVGCFSLGQPNQNAIVKSRAWAETAFFVVANENKLLQP